MFGASDSQRRLALAAIHPPSHRPAMITGLIDMRTALRPRYYCDHCNKGNGSPSAMKRHEAGCTLNPNRVCRMCALVGLEQETLTHLLTVLDAAGFAAMRDLCTDCPACTLAAIRARSDVDPETGPYISGPEDGREAWSYQQDKKSWWDAYNSARAERY